ncbi:hypothetical protein BDD12DRAFT_465179 [Trichophaea hybrida]|nr:hypothetical protein BDD12DRAFT_465179 [Trichophaea hybrida]
MVHQRTAPLYRQTLKSLVQLISLFEDGRPIKPLVSEGTNSLTLSQILKDECGRFRVWAENVGAHRTGRMSLDHRLREASRVKKVVIDLLEGMRTALQEAIGILSGNPDSSTSDEGSWDSDSEEEEEDLGGTSLAEPNESLAIVKSATALEECLIDITHFITCLYKFSIATQNPTPRDRLEKCAKINMSFFETFDIQHVTEKFLAAREHDYLIQRLGRANTRRRQLLKYYEEHHEKIVGQIVSDLEPGDTEVVERDKWDASSETNTATATTVTTGLTLQTGTTVSTYVPRNDPEVMCTDATDASSESGQSHAESDFTQTSYASSTGGMGSLRVPEPPQGYDVHFECPYCFTLTVAETRLSWIRHVFRDLRAYVCTFKECKRSEYLFVSRHEWFQHERAEHRRQWVCSACSIIFDSKEEFRQHLHDTHPDQTLQSQLEILIERAERPIETAQPCPLCKEPFPPHQLQRHLGRHMQQIALFVLPNSAEDEDDDVEDDGLDDKDSDSHEGHSEEQGDLDDTPQDNSDDAASKEPKPPSLEPEDDFTGTLHDAVKTRKAAAVKRLLASGIDPNSPNSDGDIPIHLAADQGDATILKSLLDCGADIHAKTENGWTALYKAARGGYDAAVQLLLDRGADIEVQAKENWRALHIAAFKGHETTVRLLLDRDADIQPGIEDGSTVLYLAAEKGHEATVRLLLDRGADIEAKRDIGATPLVTKARQHCT